MPQSRSRIYAFNTNRPDTTILRLTSTGTARPAA
jgi:hypothetical protein